MQHIRGRKIPFTCTSLYLGDLPEEITRNDRYLLNVLIVAAKKAITRKWLQTDPPMVDNWLKVIAEINEIKRLTFLLRLKNDLYISKWSKRRGYLLTCFEVVSSILFYLFVLSPSTLYTNMETSNPLAISVSKKLIKSKLKKRKASCPVRCLSLVLPELRY